MLILSINKIIKKPAFSSRCILDQCRYELHIRYKYKQYEPEFPVTFFLRVGNQWANTKWAQRMCGFSAEIYLNEKTKVLPWHTCDTKPHKE